MIICSFKHTEHTLPARSNPTDRYLQQWIINIGIVLTHRSNPVEETKNKKRMILQWISTCRIGNFKVVDKKGRPSFILEKKGREGTQHISKPPLEACKVIYKIEAKNVSSRRHDLFKNITKPRTIPKYVAPRQDNMSVNFQADTP